MAQKRAPQSAPSVKGIYENFTVGAGSGDLEGMRVVLFTAHDEYYAIVQIAQGGAEDPAPEFVKANVKGTKVDFTVGTEKYTGTVTAAGLKLKTGLLKRKPCADFFK
jgi:hypothetical protein